MSSTGAPSFSPSAFARSTATPRGRLVAASSVARNVFAVGPTEIATLTLPVGASCCLTAAELPSFRSDAQAVSAAARRTRPDLSRFIVIPPFRGHGLPPKRYAAEPPFFNQGHGAAPAAG